MGKGKTEGPLREAAWQFLQRSPPDGAIPLIGSHLREVTTHAHAKTCLPMFRATLFLKSARSGNNPKLQLMNGYNKMWYIDTEYLVSSIWYIDNRVVSSNKKERRTDTYCYTDEPGQQYAK